MKTTIEISEDLMKKAKALAARRNSTLRAVIEQGIRATLQEDRRDKAFTLTDKSVGGEGMQDEFRDRPWSDLRDASYEGRGS